MKILFFADPMGTSSETFKEEGNYCRRYFKEHIFEDKKFDFEITVNSLDIETKVYDILIFDFGGVGIGAPGLITSLSRQILKLIEDKPNTLFIAWTHFTNEYLKDECKKELGTYPNLISRDNAIEKVIKGINNWINLGK